MQSAEVCKTALISALKSGERYNDVKYVVGDIFREVWSEEGTSQ